MCANAVEHTASGAGGVFSVEVAFPADGVAYVAVTDGGGAGEPVALPLTGWEDMAEGGRGLALVAALASRWGYQDAPGPGRTVWAQAAWPIPVPSSALPEQRLKPGWRARHACPPTPRVTPAPPAGRPPESRQPHPPADRRVPPASPVNFAHRP